MIGHTCTDGCWRLQVCKAVSVKRIVYMGYVDIDKLTTILSGFHFFLHLTSTLMRSLRVTGINWVLNPESFPEVAQLYNLQYLKATMDASTPSSNHLLFPPLCSVSFQIYSFWVRSICIYLTSLGTEPIQSCKPRTSSCTARAACRGYEWTRSLTELHLHRQRTAPWCHLGHGTWMSRCARHITRHPGWKQFGLTPLTSHVQPYLTTASWIKN